MARIHTVVRHEPSTDKVEVLYAGTNADEASKAFDAVKPGPAVCVVLWHDNAAPRRRYQHDAVEQTAPAPKGKKAVAASDDI